ncbi:hypothetical protein PT974_06411 [Cladobotryum mycophilum]|uniref:Uncharacterized protein n=1 Tax=Cladobotryum mycophilum TaxID=491253 RepID=A0ABR0SMF6_9HYPO
MTASTLSSGTKEVPYMPMTLQAIPCPAPVLEDDFDSCRIPGGLDLWSNGGFYSPGECFVGYRAMCTQTSALSNGWPIRESETAVRCIPIGYDCNDKTRDQRYATSDFGGTILSAPAFEIRWRSEDLKTGSNRLPPGVPTLAPIPSESAMPGSSAVSPDATTTSAITNKTPANQPTSPSTHSPGSKFVLTPSSTAGVAVGSCLGAIAVMSVIIFLLVRRRRRIREGPDRLPEDPWDQQDPYQGTARLGEQIPVELEDKQMEPRELSAETRPGISKTANPNTHNDFILRIPHISVNSTPVEVAAEPIQASKDNMNEGDKIMEPSLPKFT